MIGGLREACPLDDGRKGLQLGELGSSHSVLIAK
jgi:hypothetical protein